MPPQTDQLQISPYTTTVPLVQVPPEQMESQSRPAAPLQGDFTRKGTGALAIGDSLLKGFMAGHQAKEQRKYAQAQATVAAADAASEAAYQKYQEALQAAGGQENEASKAAYGEYQKVFTQGKQAKAALVIPEKPAKGQQAAGKKGEKKTAWSSFKDFFEANPHIVPQIALMTMTPKPQGLTPQGQTEVQQSKEAQQRIDETTRRQKNEEIYQAGYAIYANLPQDQVDDLSKDPKWKAGYDTWQNAAAALRPMKYTGTTRLYRIPRGDGTFHDAWLHPEEAPPDAEPVQPGTQLKPGTEPYFHTQYALKYGLDPQKIPPETEKYLHDYWAWKQQYGKQWSDSTVDIKGNRHTSSGKTPPPPPTPPAGVQPVEEGMAPPPTARAGQRGGITPPPQAAGSTQAVYQRNQQWAKPGPYATQLSAPEEQQFQAWVKQNNIPWQDSPTADYDMRGYWKALQSGDPLAKQAQNGHFPDKWKTPYHKTFSNESQYAQQNAPSWQGNVLKDSTGKVIADESQRRGMAPPPTTGRGAKPFAPQKKGEPDTQYTARVTYDAQKEQSDGYAKAETDFNKALTSAETARNKSLSAATKADDSDATARANAEYDATVARAKADLLTKKEQVRKKYDARVRQIGGTPGDQGKQQEEVRYYQGYPYVKDPATGQWKLKAGK